MKEYNSSNIPKETIYKDVVIIGNGPSGISLSYMLAGHWPYWQTDKIVKHPDELLRARLNFADSSLSLVEQDLVMLADGLEGRSTNPVSLLLDSLQHPCADLGMELPCMLEYKYHPEKQIDHIVLGKGPAGGSWHRMDPNLRTLSLSAWMSLPGLDFNKWEQSHPIRNDLEKIISTTLVTTVNPKMIKTKQRDFFNSFHNDLKAIKNVNDSGGTDIKKATNCKSCNSLREKSQMMNGFIKNDNNNNNNNNTNNNNEYEHGALCCTCSKNDVNNIKSKLIDNQKLINSSQSNIDYERNNIIIDNARIKSMPPRRNLSLKREDSKEVQTRALISRVAEYYESYVKIMGLENFFFNNTSVLSVAPLSAPIKNERFKNARWIVCGVDNITGKKYCIVCKNLVLANGSSDMANRLGLQGEGVSTPWVTHELPQLEAALEKLTNAEIKKLKSVIIVGAGLSAADAVTICRSSGVNVIHVYRNRTAGLDKMLPENVYPEYHEVHKMMKDINNTYNCYTPMPEHTIADIQQLVSGEHKVTVQHLKTGEMRELECSFLAILIGSRPDLRFLTNISNKCETLNEQKQHTYAINKTEQMSQQQNDVDNLEHISSLTKKFQWFKNLCAKSKHLNLCDKTKRNEYKKVCNNNYTPNGLNASAEEKVINLNNDCKTIGNNSPENGLIKKPKCYTEESACGTGLGENLTKPIDCKTNPIAVDKYTNELLHTPKGLYAMGPLVGDNFVRFIPGGGLAITSALHKEND